MPTGLMFSKYEICETVLISQNEVYKRHEQVQQCF